MRGDVRRVHCAGGTSGVG